ncbi:UvrD-helicase domain-containing protein [Neobacillus sp. LXY-4]|uniref:UvrD-helicase domain-containing protein n=1 Tax=Neobacillus sp. LXY-4 TaxID=3379826 RepID=UPI003EE1F6D3
MNNQIIDQSARDKITFDLQTNFLVEAGAGSGKTKSLVDRMVNLIYTGSCEINEIVAITFTRKAADELKIRFQSMLEKTWKEEQKDKEKHRLEVALQNIESCFLGTVHAFCAKLLRERPIEAGLDLNFSELEEGDDVELLEEAWQVYLYKLQQENSGELQKIYELGMTVDQLFHCLKEMKEYPDVLWVTTKMEKPDLSAPFKSFIKLVKEAQNSIPEQEPDKGYDSLQKTIVIACKKERHIDPKKDRDLIEFYELFNKNLKPTLNRWKTKEDAKYYAERISSEFEQFIKPLIKQWKENCHPIIVAFLQGALAEYEKLKSERSLLNFQDLLLNAAHLLKENPPVRKYFQEKYKVLLIDEFQDTDPIQAELMFFLVSENIHEKNWISCRPKPGSLFIVGDPKQAIYRFRRADIDTYNRVKQLMEEHGGEVLQLTMNFRTLDCVTTKLNSIFANYLPQQETLYQAAYRPLNSFHLDDGKGFTGMNRLTVPSDYTLKQDIMTKDAENIAAAILNLMERGYSPKDFMVLTRYTEGIAFYANIIEQAGVPVSISGEIVIGEIKEFQELEMLMQVFTDPADEVSLIGAMRGMFFGISDEELYRLKMAGGSFSIYSELPSSLDTELKERFDETFAKLRLYQKWIRTLAPTVAIEKVIEDIGLPVLLMNSGQSKRAYKSLMQILAALRKQEANGNTTFKQVTTLLVEMINEKTVVANLEEDADAVRVMNVHKAKGLEAPIVFLAHPAKQVSTDSFLSKHIKREDFLSKGYFCFRVKNGNVQKDLALPFNWEVFKEEELLYLAEEELRILYVAATRAEKALIISSSAKSDKKNPWEPLFIIDEIIELEITNETPILSTYMSESILIEEYNQASLTMEKLKNLNEKSYDHWNPTKEKDFSTVSFIEREEGGGKQFGSFIHDVLEKVVQGTVSLDAYLKIAMEKYSIQTERTEEIKEWVSRFMMTSIWAELKIAEEIITEVPFTFKVKKEQPLYLSVAKSEPHQDHPILVKGIIDLIYKLEDGWVIVDYKTDRPKNPEDIPKLASFYQSQLSFYKDAWEELTKEKVSKTILYFIAVDSLYIE